MTIFHRINEGWKKFIFCYSTTNNFSSFLSLIWFTKVYRFSKNKITGKRDLNKSFSISLTAYPGKKIFLRIYAGDIDIFYEIFYKKVYALPRNSNEKIIIDAGANIGLATLFMQYQMPNATIYCIEPDPDNFRFLQKNLREEIDNGKVKPIMAGLSGSDGFMNLNQKSLKYNSSLTAYHDGEQNRIKVYSMGTFMKEFDIDKVGVLKMDVEGSEECIFENDLSWINNMDCLLIEFHSKKIEKMCGEKLALNKFAFNPHHLRENTDVFHFVRNE